MKSKPNRNINWTKIFLFYIIACAISWPFFAWRDLFNDSWKSSNIPSVLRNLSIMWGPGLSAVLCFYIYRREHVRTISLTGTSLTKSIMFFGLPYIVWFIVLIINPSNITIDNLLGMIFFGFFMILGEELGWRGFLHDSLRNISEWKRWIILGLMWEFWHFTRGLTNGNISQILIRKFIFIVCVILASFVIGKLTEKTKSLLIGITLHSWINIQFEVPHINTQIAGVISVFIWCFLIWKWEKVPFKL